MSDNPLSSNIDFEEVPMARPAKNLEALYLRMAKRIFDYYEDGISYPFFKFALDLHGKAKTLGLNFKEGWKAHTGAEKQMQALAEKGYDPFKAVDIEIVEKKIEIIGLALQERLKELDKQKDFYKTDTEKNAEFLSNAVQFSDIRKQLFMFFACMPIGRFSVPLETLFPPLMDHGEYTKAVAYLLDLDAKEVEEELAADNVLMGMRFLIKADSPKSPHTVDYYFAKILQQKFRSTEDLIYTLLGERKESELEPEDFDYPGSEFDDMERKLDTYLENSTLSLRNMTLAGPPGTGKTERMITLGKKMGVPMIFTGTARKSGDNGFSREEPTREDRFNALMRSAYILDRTKIRAVLVFDEAEDILRDLNRKETKEVGSKAFTNDFLETLGAPVVFISNRTDLFDPATIRRIMPIYHVNYMPFAARKKAVAKKLETRLKITLDDEALDRLAKHSEALTIAVIDTCIKGVSEDLADRNNGQILEALETELRRAMIAVNNGFLPLPYNDNKLPANFDVNLISASEDIAVLHKNFAEASADSTRACANTDILIVGAPGTGRKTIAKFLSTAFGKETKIVSFDEEGSIRLPSLVHARDLECAALDQQILVLDGLQKFFDFSYGHPLIDRIRNHPYPTFLIGTLAADGKRLPSNFARDFSFAIRTGNLNTLQLLAASKHILGVELKPADTQETEDLTIEDIQTVFRRLSACSSVGNKKKTLEALRSIGKIREAVDQSKFGFTP